MSKKIKHKPFTDEQYAKLIGKNPVIDLMFHTGVRIMECKRIVDKWNGKDEYIDIKTKKSGDDTNRIFLTQDAIDAIKRCLSDKWQLKGMSVKTYERRVYKTFYEVGIIDSLKGKKKHTSHTMRATTASRLHTNGTDAIMIQSILNHKSLEQTAQYIHVSEKLQRSALGSLSQFDSIHGLTHQEAINKILEKDFQIARLEEALKLANNRVNEMQKELIKIRNEK